ncbi:MAG: 3-oxoacid CoA-transferase subunit A [Azoarcus sp.]|jgi:acetate CoA/acetoacetate CoA-transferase alpha subunit|nr:3-oxoacid CoA-transferase subunit A [Azoarcus sp.]
MSKILSVQEAVALIPEDAVLMIGGFLGIGTPPRLMDEIVRQGKRGLTVIANDTGFPDKGIGKLIAARLVRRAIVSHIGTNPETQRQMISGELDVELVPQGTLAERVRAGGHGLGGILTAVGVGTSVAQDKHILTVDGDTFLLERPLKAGFALLNAKRADYRGNLQYAMTARNFNPLMAMAADVVIAEVENVVPTGSIAPDNVDTSHVLVDWLVKEEGGNGR